MRNDDYQPATGIGRFGVRVEGNEVKIKMKIFIDSALNPAQYAQFQLQAEPIIKQHWEGKYGFTCAKAGYAGVYRPVFRFKFAQAATDAHWAMYLSEGTTPAVSREAMHKFRNLENLPRKVAMRPDSTSDVNSVKGTLGGQILESLKGSFPFYADAAGGNLSSHAQSELKLLAKEIKKLDAAAVLAVTGYGSGKAALENSTIALLNGAGLANVLKRKSGKWVAGKSPKTGSSNYVKVVLQSGLGQADPSTNGLFHYPATIVHEFGHMLGLVDEYHCLSKQAADKMAELDFVHPSEKTLFEGYHTTAAAQATADSQSSQAVLAEWCKAAGCEPAQYGTRTISIMSSGAKFYPRHFITIWKAITDLAVGVTQPGDWSIVKL